MVDFESINGRSPGSRDVCCFSIFNGNIASLPFPLGASKIGLKPSKAVGFLTGFCFTIGLVTFPLPFALVLDLLALEGLLFVGLGLGFG